MAIKAKKNIADSFLKVICFQVIPMVAVVSLSAFIVVSSLVGMFPETFGPIFGRFISYQEDGVYADCSLSKNRHNRLCSGMEKQASHKKTWNTIQKGQKAMPFNLH